MTLHGFLTLALAVACVALAWAWWTEHRTRRATEAWLSAVLGGTITASPITLSRDGAVTDATIQDHAVTDARIVVHFPSWMPDPPGPQIDHLGRELP